MTKFRMKIARVVLGIATLSTPIWVKALPVESPPGNENKGPEFGQNPSLPSEPDKLEPKDSSKTVPSSSEKTNPNETGSAPQKKEKEIYKSPLIGNTPGEYLRSLQVTPEQNKVIRSNSDLWFQDRFRVGFSVRPRYESINNTDFNKTTADNSNVVTGLTQFYLIADINPYVLFKATLQDSRIWGGEQSPAYTGTSRFELGTNGGVIYDTTKASQNQVPVLNTTSFREAFFDLRTPDQSLRLRLGRQIIDFGDGRILGAANDNQIGNSSDGLRFTAKYGNNTLDTFGTVVTAQYNSSGLVSANTALPNSYLVGANNFTKFASWLALDIYDFTVIRRYNPANNSTVVTKPTDQQNTYGFRLTNRTENNSLPEGVPFDWTVEAAWQGGYNGLRVGTSWLQNATDPSTGTGAINAFNNKNFLIENENQKYASHFLTLQAGVHPSKNLRIGLQYVYASGDPNRSDSSVGTWNAPFPTRRIASGFIPYSGNGIAGTFFWQNTKDYSVHIKWTSGKWGTFIFNPHFYYKAKLQDAYYNNNGIVTGTLAGSTEDFSNNQQYNANSQHLGKKIGTEVDFIYMVTPWENVSIWGGVAFLRAGDSIRNAHQTVPTSSTPSIYTGKPDASYFFLQTVFAI